MSVLHEPTPEVVQAAAEWLALLHSGESDEAQRLAFVAWRNADPCHMLAVSRMEGLWGRFDGLPAAPAHAALERVLAPAGREGARRVASVLGICIALGAAWQAQERAPVWLADQRTAVGERRDLVLEDHSRLQLNSDSAVDLHFDARQRLIELHRGELWVEVAKDPQRPFVVRTEQGTVTALGTRFLVRREEGRTRVVVLESAVAAQPQAAHDARAKVASGQQAILLDDRVQGPGEFSGADPAAWTRGLLKVDDRPLVEVLDELSRYRKGVIRYDREVLSGLRVSGVFPLDDSDAALAALSASLPIDIRRYTGWLLVVTPKG